MPKQKTNLTEQRTQLQSKALTMHRDHGWHMVSFCAKRSVSKSGKWSILYDSFTTPGWEHGFIGEKGAMSSYGDGIFNLVKRSFENYSEQASAEEHNHEELETPVNNHEEL